MMLSQDEINHYHEQGYLIVRNVFNSAEISDLRFAFDELTVMASKFDEDTFVGRTFFNMMKPCDPFDPEIEKYETIKGLIRRVTYPYLTSQKLNQYRTHPALLTVISQLIGNDVVQVVNQANFNPPKVGKGWGWHQDYRFRRQGLKNMPFSFVQSLLAVDHCHSENGALRIVPESTKLGPMRLDQSPKEAETYFNKDLAITPEMHPGDLILFNPYLIHGSTENKTDHPRRVYINGYAKKTDCEHGITVLNQGKIVTHIDGVMEYEYRRDKLKLASKY